MYKRPIIFFLLILFPLLLQAATETSEKGTLIVTYQTGLKAERLNRIRFWLKKEGANPQIYPKRDAYVDGPSSVSRMVVINDLSPGHYTIEFAIPNGDAFFEAPPTRRIEIAADKIVKIDQVIKIR